MRTYVVTGRVEKEFEVFVLAESEEEAMDMVEAGELELEFVDPTGEVIIESVEESEEEDE